MTAPPKPRRKLLNMRLPVDLIDRIDAHRGKENRTAFFERVAEAELAGDTPPPQNGTPSVVPSASTEKAKPDPADLHPGLKRASELEDTKAAWIARRTKALTTSKCGPRIAEARARREANQRFG
jgi:hypothetical protein